MIKELFGDIIKYLPARVVPGIVGLISIPIITRLFSPEDYGSYSIILATVMVLTAFLGWLPMSIIRFYPQYEKENRLHFFHSNIMLLSIISVSVVAVIFYSIILIIKRNLSSDLVVLAYFGIGVFIVTALFEVFQTILRSRRKVGWYSGFAVWKSTIGFGLGLILIFAFRISIENLLQGVIIGVVVIFPLLWKKAIGSGFHLHPKINFPLAKDMFLYSFPLVVGNLAAWILSLSDRFILEFYHGSKDVGIYSASYNIADRSVLLIVNLFALAAGPISMSIWEKEGEKKSKEFVNRLTRYYLMGCIPVVVGMSVLSRPIIHILTGRDYVEGYKIIPFVTIGILFLGLQQKFQAGFLYYKKTIFVTLAIVAAGLLNVILNFLFVPKYGYFAASVTTFFSYGFLLIIMVVSSLRLFVWKFPFDSLIKMTAASLIMGIFIHFVGNRLTDSIPINLIASICLGAAIYFLVLVLLKEYTREEYQIFKSN